MFERQSWMQRVGDYPRSDAAYFALLARAVFSAGLGPRVVEARWPGIVSGFRGLEPEAVAQMDAQDVSSLLADPAVIRNRRKIEAVVANAPRFLDVVEEHGSFRRFLEELAPAQDFEAAAARLSELFVHLGPASAALFLYSAGWRPGVAHLEGVKAAA